MILGPRNLVFADCFFSILESLGFFVLTWFSPFKNKNKSKWRLQSKTVPPWGRIFQNSKINPHFLFTFFLQFKSESRRSVDRVGSTNLLGFPHLKIKIKVSDDSKVKPFLLGDGFYKTRKSTHIFFSHFSFNLKASRAGPWIR